MLHHLKPMPCHNQMTYSQIANDEEGNSSYEGERGRFPNLGSESASRTTSERSSPADTVRETLAEAVTSGKKDG